ncbi:hypothetical protein VNI00_011009 [Paramarasmius palmivorus]|uniref:RNase III domain-containing protein n=1 Tax=Paramarasmius palmivorus TaxID=297713 RepID=A0AAW0CHC0_9AGAR
MSRVLPMTLVAGYEILTSVSLFLADEIAEKLNLQPITRVASHFHLYRLLAAMRTVTSFASRRRALHIGRPLDLTKRNGIKHSFRESFLLRPTAMHEGLEEHEPKSILIRRAVQREVNKAISELDEVVPPELTSGAQSLFEDCSNYEAWRGLETTGDAMQSMLVMEVVMDCIPNAKVGEMKFIASVVETNETLHHLVAKIRGVDQSLLIGKTGGCALEMIIGMLARGGGVEIARSWYSRYYPSLIRRAFRVYRKLQDAAAGMALKGPSKSIRSRSNGASMFTSQPKWINTAAISPPLQPSPFLPSLQVASTLAMNDITNAIPPYTFNWPPGPFPCGQGADVMTPQPAIAMNQTTNIADAISSHIPHANNVIRGPARIFFSGLAGAGLLPRPEPTLEVRF